MIIDTKNFWHTPVRSLAARVELYSGSALADAYTAYYALKSFTIERIGEESKFFGYGVCQKMNLHLVDKDRFITINSDHSLKAYLSTGGELISSFPTFYVTRVNRDENTNELSITAYDSLYNAVEHTVSELGLTSYSIREFAAACGALLGCAGLVVLGVNDNSFDTSYAAGALASFDGTENIRSALDAVAEVTQTIYYINSNNELVFKRFDMDGAPVLSIDKEKYITLESGANRRLATIAHVTELGDNVSASTVAAGSTQYIRDNPFWELRTDISALVDGALAAVGGLTINQFVCSWRGDPALEIGDKIELITKDDEAVISYVLDDVITYDGALSEETQWSYTEDGAESESNPTSLGEVLNKTYARVDKANKQIELVVNQTDSNNNRLSALELNNNSITTRVEHTETRQDETDKEIETLTEKASLIVTQDEITATIGKELSNGVDKVTTAEKKYTFNDSGLNISDSESEMATQITEDGMKVYKNEQEVLTANNQGVKAIDLHATTFLIIGETSRLENYEKAGEMRTACFWIGR